MVHRRGYTARPEPPPLDLRETYTRARLSEAAGAGIALDDIKVSATASRSIAGPGPERMRVDVRISSGRLSLQNVAGKHEATMDLMVLCGDANGSVVGKVDQQIRLSIDDETLRKHSADGIPYTGHIQPTRTATRVKVIVYEYASDRVGTAFVTVR